MRTCYGRPEGSLKQKWLAEMFALFPEGHWELGGYEQIWLGNNHVHAYTCLSSQNNPDPDRDKREAWRVVSVSTSHTVGRFRICHLSLRSAAHVGRFAVLWRQKAMYGSQKAQ
jgi:hypothetical protein